MSDDVSTDVEKAPAPNKRARRRSRKAQQPATKLQIITGVRREIPTYELLSEEGLET